MIFAGIVTSHNNSIQLFTTKNRIVYFCDDKMSNIGGVDGGGGGSEVKSNGSTTSEMSDPLAITTSPPTSSSSSKNAQGSSSTTAATTSIKSTSSSSSTSANPSKIPPISTSGDSDSKKTTPSVTTAAKVERPPPRCEPHVEPVNGIVYPPTVPPASRPGRITNQLLYLKNNIVKGMSILFLKYLLKKPLIYILKPNFYFEKAKKISTKSPTVSCNFERHSLSSGNVCCALQIVKLKKKKSSRPNRVLNVDAEKN